MKAVLPGVAVVPVRSPTLPPATHTNAWVLGSHRYTVVDPASPWADEQERLSAALAAGVVERIFLTHHHVDHVSGAEDLARRTGAPIVAHPLTAQRLAFPVDGLIEEGDSLQTDELSWQALHTPGHAPGHLCLHNAESATLVAGDMVASVGTIVLDPPEGNLGQYLDSLDRLRSLGDGRLLPAHGDVIEDGVAKLTEYIDHRNMRTDQVQAGLQSGPAGPIELVPAIYPELPEIFHFLAARQVLCHLLWLVERGSVKKLGERFELKGEG